MDVLRLVAGVCVLLLMTACRGDALKCYSCYMTKSVSPRCGDPFRLRYDDYMDDCDKVRPPDMPGYSFCKKIKQTNERSVIVTRMCDWSMNETSVCDKFPAGSEDMSLVHCSACATDGCNGALRVLPTVWLCVALLPLLPGS